MRRLSVWTQKTIEFCFYTLFFITPFIFNPGNSELFELPKMYFVYTLTIIILGTWITKSVLAGRFAFQRTFLDIPLLLFILSQLVSTYFSVDRHTSIFGYYSRVNGGLLSLVSYLLLYWAYVSNLSQKEAIKSILCLLVSSFVISLWAIAEHFGVSPSCYLLQQNLKADCWIQDVQSRVFATLGQPNWLAAFLVAVTPLTLTLLPKAKSIITTPLHSSVVFLLPSVFVLATFFTKSRSGFLGLAAAVSILIFFHLPHRFFIRLGYSLLIAISGFFLWQYNLSDCFDLNPNQLSISSGTESCKIRTIVWKGALEVWKNNQIFGTGPETFAYSYYSHRPVEHNKTSEWELLYNKAHNEYLNYLANTGVVGLGTYFLLIGSFVFWSTRQLKNQKSKYLNQNEKLFTLNCGFSIYTLHLAFLAGYFGILVTNFFGFSTVTVNLLFFLLPAVTLTITRETPHKIRSLNFAAKRLLLLPIVLLVTCYLLLITYRYWFADIHYANSNKYDKKNLYQQAAKEAREALFLRDNEPVYYNELAEAASYLAVSQYETGNTATAADLTQLAIDSSHLATEISPYDLNFLKTRSIVFARLSLVNPAYAKQALEPLERARQLAPTDPKIHYNLGVLYERAGEKEKTEAMLKYALELKDNYKDPYIGLAEFYAKNGQKEKARQHLEFVLQNIDSQDQNVKSILENLQNY